MPIVVSGGSNTRANGRSSKPTTETSPGIRSPSSRAARYTPPARCRRRRRSRSGGSRSRQQLVRARGGVVERELRARLDRRRQPGPLEHGRDRLPAQPEGLRLQRRATAARSARARARAGARSRARCRARCRSARTASPAARPRSRRCARRCPPGGSTVKNRKPSTGPARSASNESRSRSGSFATSTSATAYPARHAASCAPRITGPKNGCVTSGTTRPTVRAVPVRSARAATLGR